MKPRRLPTGPRKERSMPYYASPYTMTLLALEGLNAFGIPVNDDSAREKMKREAYAILTDLTGQDFGYDPDAWRAWMEATPDWDTWMDTTSPDWDREYIESIEREISERLRTSS